MTVPSLKTIEGALERMVKQASVVAEKATWVWPWGFATRRRGEGNGRGGSEVGRPTEAAVGHDRWADGKGVHPPSTEWTVRTEKARAGQLIMEAAAKLEAAEGALDKAAKAAGRGDPPAGRADKPWPPTASKGEITKAKQMQRWRDQERKKGVARGTY